MKRTSHVALALVAATGILATASASEPKRIADYEARFLEKITAKANLPEATVESIRATLAKFDASRRTTLQDLANTLKDLVRANASGPETELEGLLQKLDGDRKDLQDQRQAKREEIGSHFSETQKLHLLGKMHERLAARAEEGRGGRLRGFLVKHIPTLLTRVLGVEQATVDTLKATFESRQPVRDELRSSWKDLGERISTYLASGKTDEESARLLVIQAKELHQKGIDTREAALEEIRGKLTVKQRADLVSKVFQGLQKVGGFASYFVDIEELKFFL